MNWLTRVALKKRWLTFLVVALITGASIWATLTLKMELIPSIEFPITSVIGVYPQAKPEEVMNKLSIPIEGAIAGTPGLKHLTATSTEGATFIFALFDYGTDMKKANDIIGKNLSQLTFPPEVRDLPAQMPEIQENPRLFPIDLDMMPVVYFSLGGDLPADQLKDIATAEILPRLQAIPGVYWAGIEGGGKEQVAVRLDPARMNASGVSVAQVSGALSARQYSSLEEVEAAALGSGVVLGDVARVDLSPPPGVSITRTNGKPSVSILVLKYPEANTVSVANAVIAEAEKIKGTLQGGVEIFTIYDQSEYIEKSIDDLARDVIIGGVLAVLVVFLFLMAFRASLVTAVSIPLSILIGFLAMRGFGITINILTLSAMAIAVGRVIDDSIVVLEVIFRRIQRGEGFREAALNGTREIAAPIISATLATVIIFIPLTFVGGLVGEMFVPFAETVTFALIASLLVALMVIPALCNLLISRKKTEVKAPRQWYQGRIYTPMLKWSLAHRALTLIIAVVLFFGSLGLIPVIGTSFIPSMGEKTLIAEIEMPPRTDIRTTEQVAMEVEKVLGQDPKVITYDTTVGTSNSIIGGISALMGGGSNTASITIILDPSADLDQEAAALRRACEGVVQGGLITIGRQEGMMGTAGASNVDLTIQGETYEDISSTAQRLLAELEGMEGITDLTLDFATVEPKLSIQPDQAKVMASGLPLEQLQTIREEFVLLLMGGTVGQASIEGRSYDIYLKGIAPDLDSLETARALRVGWPKSVALGDVAAVEIGQQPTSIQRIDQKLAASIAATITEENVGGVNRQIQSKIASLDVPPGTEVTMGGVAEAMNESFGSMFIAVAVAIALAFAIMVFTFRSFLNSVIVMASLPLASIGAMLGLLVAGQPLGVSAMMGVLMLVGIVLTNAVVLISVVTQLRKSGLSIYDALIQGGQTRLRPILMTALTTMVAMLPLALGLGEGTLMASELAAVVIGGLFSSTFLTLLVIPVLYSLAEGLRERLAGRRLAATSKQG